MSELNQEDQQAIERFYMNPALLDELLRNSQGARARAITAVFSQPGYVENSRLSLEEFTALAELTMLPCLEVVPLRQNPETGKTQTLLCERAENDPWWPGELASPGTVILKTDMDRHQFPFDRILGKLGELQGGFHVTGEPQFVEFSLRGSKDIGRGAEIGIVHYIEAEGEVPEIGKWVDVDNTFPGNAGGKVIEHHIPMIFSASRMFNLAKQVQAA